MAKMRELERRFERTRTSFPISVLIFWERWFNDDFLRRSQRKLLKERRNKLLNPWNYQYWLKFKFKFLLNIFHKSTPNLSTENSCELICLTRISHNRFAYRSRRASISKSISLWKGISNVYDRKMRNGSLNVI